MAHFVLEYSANIDPADLDLQALFARLHDCAADSGLFPLKGLRSRAYACSEYRLADGNPRHAFVHLQMLLGAGRSAEQRRETAAGVRAVLESHFDALFHQRGVALSFEMRELEPEFKFNRNNIQDYL